MTRNALLPLYPGRKNKCSSTSSLLETATTSVVPYAWLEAEEREKATKNPPNSVA
jgi:hypothetical protein